MIRNDVLTPAHRVSVAAGETNRQELLPEPVGQERVQGVRPGLRLAPPQAHLRRLHPRPRPGVQVLWLHRSPGRRLAYPCLALVWIIFSDVARLSYIEHCFRPSLYVN